MQKAEFNESLRTGIIILSIFTVGLLVSVNTQTDFLSKNPTAASFISFVGYVMFNLDRLAAASSMPEVVKFTFGVLTGLFPLQIYLFYLKPYISREVMQKKKFRDFTPLVFACLAFVYFYCLGLIGVDANNPFSWIERDVLSSRLGIGIYASFFSILTTWSIACLIHKIRIEIEEKKNKAK